MGFKVNITPILTNLEHFFPLKIIANFKPHITTEQANLFRGKD